MDFDPPNRGWASQSNKALPQPALRWGFQNWGYLVGVIIFRESYYLGSILRIPRCPELAGIWVHDLRGGRGSTPDPLKR